MNQELLVDNVSPEQEIICETIRVTDDVGSNSIIDAVQLEVEGTTQEDSKQFVKNALIHTHKGYLRCHDAKITLLDGGEVHASHVHVDTCINAEIYAQDVFIQHLTNNSRIYASNSITIEHISGSSNNLKISYRDVPIIMSKIDLIQDDISELEDALQKSNEASAKEIALEISRLQEELDGIFHSVKNAKITIRKKVNASNTIIFQIDPYNFISYETKKNEYKPFCLEYNDSTITLFPAQESITIQK